MVSHGTAEGDGRVEIVVVILQRHGNRFTHSLETGKVDGAANVMLFKDTVQSSPVSHIYFIEVQRFAGDLLYTLQRLGTGVYQVIRYDNAVALFKKFNAGVAADIPGAAGYQYIHFFTSQSSRVWG